MSKKQVAKINNFGTYRIYYDDSNYFYPYSIYYEYGYIECDSGYRQHKRKIAQYEDMKSCMIHITNEIDP